MRPQTCRANLWLTLLGALTGCFLDQAYKHRGPTVPEDLGDGWTIGTPEAVGIDPAVLAGIKVRFVAGGARHFGAVAPGVAAAGFEPSLVSSDSVNSRPE